MINCLVCNADFQSTDKRHGYCSNLCVVKVYSLRKKARLQINAALKLLKTPDDIKDFDNSLQYVLEGVLQ